MVAIDQKLSRKIANIGFVCVCMVVGLHWAWCGPTQRGSWQWCVLTLLIQCIYHIAVPTFFAISGFLMAGHFGENGWWRRELCKRLRSLLIPYVIWNSFYLLLASLFVAVGIEGFSSSADKCADLSLQSWIRAFGVTYPWECRLCSMWYVRCLIGVAFVAPIFVWVRNFSRGAITLAAMFIASFCLSLVYSRRDSLEPTVFFLFGWVRCILFFSAGAYLRWHGDKIVNWIGNSRIEKLGCFLFAMGVVLFVCSVWLFSVKGLVAMVAMLLVMGGMWMSFPDWHWPKWLTASAFPVFCLHYLFLNVWNLIGFRDVCADGVIEHFVGVAMIVISSISLAVVIRKLMPSVAAFIFGGR